MTKESTVGKRREKCGKNDDLSKNGAFCGLVILTDKSVKREVRYQFCRILRKPAKVITLCIIKKYPADRFAAGHRVILL